MELLILLVVKQLFAIVTYLLGFHESIRFSKTLSEYQEQLYSLEKTANIFADPPKKCV